MFEFILGGIILSDSCDHKRAIEYFTESILSKCPMRAFPCDNMVYFERGWCILPDRIFPSMGFNAYKSKGTTSGKHFPLTNSLSPFCGKFLLKEYKRLKVEQVDEC